MFGRQSQSTDNFLLIAATTILVLALQHYFHANTEPQSNPRLANQRAVPAATVASGI
jgi:hypothetical protein